MEYKVNNTGSVYEITLSGKMTFNDNAEFKKLLDNFIASSASTIDMNCAGLEFLDSAALGMFMLLKDRADKAERKVVFRNFNGQPEKMAKISKFHDIFTIY